MIAAQRLWLVAGGAPRELEHVVQYPPGGTLGIGGTGPILSGDAKWIAYLDAKGIAVTPTTGGKKHRIPDSLKGGRVELLLSGFSPDDKTLLFHRAEVAEMEPVPVPEGVTLGFHQLQLEDMSETRLDDVQEFLVWIKEGSGWSPTSAKALFGDQDAGQPSFNGPRVVFGRSENRLTTLIWATIDLKEETKLAAPQPFAYLQWPQPSPDNTRVAYCLRRLPRQPASDLMLVEVKDPAVVKKLYSGPEGRCEYAWLTADQLLVIDSDELVTVSLDGSTESVAKNVTGFAMAGAPG